MLASWAATDTANLLLIFLIVRRRAWRIIPIFCTGQFMCILFTVTLNTLYWMPSVGDSVYHSVWLGIDQLGIILEAAAVWELFGQKRLSFIWMGLLMLVHDVLKIREYLLMDSGKAVTQMVRFNLNLILTLLMCVSIYYCSMCDDPKDPDPPVEPQTDPGAPPHKPGNG